MIIFRKQDKDTVIDVQFNEDDVSIIVDRMEGSFPCATHSCLTHEEAVELRDQLDVWIKSVDKAYE